MMDEFEFHTVSYKVNLASYIDENCISFPGFILVTYQGSSYITVTVEAFLVSLQLRF